MSSNTFSAAASAVAPIDTRSRGRFCMSATNPPPSSPSRFAAGTTTSEKNSSEVSCACMPTFARLRPRLEPGHAALHHQQADPPVPGVRVGPGHHDDQIAQLPVGDEGLLAVEHVGVPIADRGGADALQVAARAGLAHRDGGDELARAVPRQPAVPLLRGAQPEEVLAVDVVVHGEPGAGGAGPGEFLVEDQVEAVVRIAPAAVLLVHVDAEQARPPGGQPHLDGTPSRPAPTDRGTA